MGGGREGEELIFHFKKRVLLKAIRSILLYDVHSLRTLKADILVTGAYVRFSVLWHQTIRAWLFLRDSITYLPLLINCLNAIILLFWVLKRTFHTRIYLAATSVICVGYMGVSPKKSQMASLIWKSFVLTHTKLARQPIKWRYCRRTEHQGSSCWIDEQIIEEITGEEDAWNDRFKRTTDAGANSEGRCWPGGDACVFAEGKLSCNSRPGKKWVGAIIHAPSNLPRILLPLMSSPSMAFLEDGCGWACVLGPPFARRLTLWPSVRSSFPWHSIMDVYCGFTFLNKPKICPLFC